MKLAVRAIEVLQQPILQVTTNPENELVDKNAV